jgi:hypothetical protein
MENDLHTIALSLQALSQDRWTIFANMAAVVAAVFAAVSAALSAWSIRMNREAQRDLLQPSLVPSRGANVGSQQYIFYMRNIGPGQLMNLTCEGFEAALDRITLAPGEEVQVAVDGSATAPLLENAMITFVYSDVFKRRWSTYIHVDSRMIEDRFELGTPEKWTYEIKRT